MYSGKITSSPFFHGREKEKTLKIKLGSVETNRRLYKEDVKLESHRELRIKKALFSRFYQRGYSEDEFDIYLHFVLPCMFLQLAIFGIIGNSITVVLLVKQRLSRTTSILLLNLTLGK